MGLFLVKDTFEQNKFGIYRDDGLAIVETKSGLVIERLSKRLRKVFSRFHLQITIDSNLVRTDFLDVELDLRNDTYAPYRKSNFQATYVNVKSMVATDLLRKIS